MNAQTVYVDAETSPQDLGVLIQVIRKAALSRIDETLLNERIRLEPHREEELRRDFRIIKRLKHQYDRLERILPSLTGGRNISTIHQYWSAKQRLMGRRIFTLREELLGPAS